ncbi:hypothetical protein [Candidatus Rariloculus sp.]|uniref:hypothetical protein n=1 Tax=Candidatus Rariloculus sp. TaxID=3101265 RepID=UPI003D107259
MTAQHPVRRHRPGNFPAWGALALPAGILWGAVFGVLVGAFLGNAAIGAAVGAGVGIGAGMCLLAAAIVVASAKEAPDQSTDEMMQSRRRDG